MWAVFFAFVGYIPWCQWGDGVSWLVWWLQAWKLLRLLG